MAGLLLLVRFAMSHSTVELEDTDFIEPVLLWVSICMPTGSSKSGLHRFLKSIVEKARAGCGIIGDEASWLLDDQSFEKMGSIMAENRCKLLGLYDELPMFLYYNILTTGSGHI